MHLRWGLVRMSAVTVDEPVRGNFWDIIKGLVVDLFAGGGGTSEGLAMALGRDPDIAINHDAEALAMHKVNHPGTRHMINDITKVLPLDATGGQPVAILHASPDCTHFSKAKGAKPRSQFIRDLAWVVIRWAEDTHPMLITLENVEEFLTWGPLDKDGFPIKEHAGDTFRAWVKRLRRLGYKVSWRLLRACDYGAPTTRRRLFVVARLDGKTPSWPKPTHGAPGSAAVRSGKLLPWRTAAECIDWEIPSKSIFDRKKPLAINTQRRIAEGLRRYVINAAEPFLVTYYGAKKANDFRGQDLGRPLATQTTENRFGLVSPVMVTNTSGHAPSSICSPIPTLTTGSQQMLAGAIVSPNHTAEYYTPFRGQDLQEPLRTITLAPGFALASAVLSAATAPFIQHVQHSKAAHGVMPADEPLRTITAQPKGGGLAVVASLLTQKAEQNTLSASCIAKHYGGVIGHGLRQPIGTITSIDHHSLVSAYLVKMRGLNVGSPASEPLRTISAQGQHHALVTAVINKHFGSSIGQPAQDPLHTIVGKAKHSLTSCILKYYGKSDCSGLNEPLHTLTSKERMAVASAWLIQTGYGERHGQNPRCLDILKPLGTVVAGGGKHALASACMVKYYGTALGAPVDGPMPTLTTKARMGLIESPIAEGWVQDPVAEIRYLRVKEWLRSWGVIGPHDEAEIVHEGAVYRLMDITMRMLAPRELFRAQGFREDYEIAPVINGKRLTKTAQVRMCGNSVPPQLVNAIVSDNGPETWQMPEPAPACAAAG